MRSKPGYLLRISLIRRIADKVGDLTDIANRKKMAYGARFRSECAVSKPSYLLRISLIHHKKGPTTNMFVVGPFFNPREIPS